MVQLGTIYALSFPETYSVRNEGNAGKSLTSLVKCSINYDVLYFLIINNNTNWECANGRAPSLPLLCPLPQQTMGRVISILQ